jgi:hypothetical protein
MMENVLFVLGGPQRGILNVDVHLFLDPVRQHREVAQRLHRRLQLA